MTETFLISTLARWLIGELLQRISAHATSRGLVELPAVAEEAPPDTSDKLNRIVRPIAAGAALVVTVLDAIGVIHMTPESRELFAGILGVFVGGRIQSTGR